MAVESDQTILGGGVSAHGGDAPAVASGEKVCCVCGADVSGKKRMKDATGRYWCYGCGLEDSVRKHPEQAVECPECHDKFSPAKLVDFDGRKVCDACDTKLKLAKKRAEARIAAAAEEARQADARKKQIMIGVGIVGVIVVLWILSTLVT